MPPVDATLIAEMFDRHGAALVLYASQWTTAAEDCVQEAVLELARQRSRPDNPAAWLYRVVRNRALNTLRSAQRRQRREETAASEHWRRRQRAPDPQSSIELKELLGRLAADAREIVVLRVWGGLSWDEIADVVGGSRSGAQRHYVQALEQLRHLWEHQPCPKK